MVASAMMLNPQGDVVISVSSRQKFTLSKHQPEMEGDNFTDDSVGGSNDPLPFIISFHSRTVAPVIIVKSPRFLSLLTSYGDKTREIIENVLPEVYRPFSISISKKTDCLFLSRGIL